MRKGTCLGLALAIGLLALPSAHAQVSAATHGRLTRPGSEEIEFRSGPMQPDEISSYLRTMRRIIDQYNGVVFSLVSSGAAGAGANPEGMAQASAVTQQLAQEIRAVKAPQEVAAQHIQLARTLTQVEQFLHAGGGGNGPQGIMQALSLVGTVQNTMTSYRAGTDGLIRTYGLSRSLDPFGGESASQKTQMSGLVNSMKSQLTGGMMGGNNGGTASGGSSGMLGGLGNGLNGLGNGLGALGGGLGALGGGLGALGGGPGGNSSGSDANTPFGAGGTFGSGGTFNGRGTFGSGGTFSGGGTFGSGGNAGGMFGSGGGTSMFGSTGGGMGMGASDPGAGAMGGSQDASGGGLGDLNGLVKQLGEQQKAIQQLLGE